MPSFGQLPHLPNNASKIDMKVTQTIKTFTMSWLDYFLCMLPLQSLLSIVWVAASWQLKIPTKPTRRTNGKILRVFVVLTWPLPSKFEFDDRSLRATTACDIKEHSSTNTWQDHTLVSIMLWWQLATIDFIKGSAISPSSLYDRRVVLLEIGQPLCN